ncbi:MAG: DUF1549 domain-containing protein [Gemmataceae bacterium]
MRSSRWSTACWRRRPTASSWGRHWLDVARYADSNGMDENLVQATAWRYRDHVIAAFNRDLPYDRFVTEQLAGDLAAEPTPDGLVATGFLALGPKMLAEDDPVKMQMDIVDEQIDTVGKTLLGMTLGCAAATITEYDPISTADYYAAWPVSSGARASWTTTASSLAGSSGRSARATDRAVARPPPHRRRRPPGGERGDPHRRRGGASDPPAAGGPLPGSGAP